MNNPISPWFDALDSRYGLDLSVTRSSVKATPGVGSFHAACVEGNSRPAMCVVSGAVGY